MERNQKLEEALGIIWEEKENLTLDKLHSRLLLEIKEDIFEDLLKEGYIYIEKDMVKFTPKGELKAKDIIRRQRLAERLLLDVLEVGRKEMVSSACELEHIISKEVEESICILLGHPKECPHGKTIPPGECCRKAKETVESIVVPLTKLSPGDLAKVVYLLTRTHPQLHKLLSLGVVPGTRIILHQNFPSFIIQVEQTQIALEKEIAQHIYVKKSGR
ncbi:MAG: metal-dependent transcriptional regulator [Candidatus Omnitrophica bacterium]|nr:metal-dependent transcriptional regulator [Candidatus Omnitrophota bacterium]